MFSRCKKIATIFPALLLFAFVLSCSKDKKDDEPIGPLPVLKFLATDSLIRPGNMIQFIDSSINGPLTRKWYFGDGDSASEKSPFHVYDSVGTYTVTLVATNEFGTTVLTKSDFITVIVPWTGLFRCEGVMLHPTAGFIPISEDKFLTSVGPYEVSSTLGPLGLPNPIKIIIDSSDFSATVVAVPPCPFVINMQAGTNSRYDTISGKYYLWYEYSQSSGVRKIEEIYSPK